jgi:hypothetical protein
LPPLRPRYGEAFVRLLHACETLAASCGADTIVAGVNTARQAACDAMLAERPPAEHLWPAECTAPNDAGYSRAETFVLDDRR